MTREKRKPRPRDNYGGYTMEGMYMLCKPRIRKECEKAGINLIDRVTFSEIIREYFELNFNYAIYKYRDVRVFNRLGVISVLKVLCTIKNPVYWKKVKDESGNWVNKLFKTDVNSRDGYVYKLKWEFPEKYQAYNYKKFIFKPAKRWRSKVYDMVNEGHDYPEE